MLLALALLLGASAPPTLALPSSREVLPNGLTVIVSPDHSVPGVAVDLWYRVGSRDEEAGRTGFAHLFEHLMFMGARRVPYPQFDTIMEAGGGQNNATTENDRTNYYEVGPSNLLETFLWLEADRMASLGATMTADKLKAQQLVVLNERRQNYENRPYGGAELATFEQLFPPGHPYSWSTIGSAKDIEAATLADVKAFFATWYVPNNATLAVVGDVQPEAVFRLARKYFSFLPAKPLPPRKLPGPFALAAERTVTLHDKVSLPKLFLVWPSPPLFSAGDADCDLLTFILAGGKASRLYRRLVHQDGLATEVNAEQMSLELQSVFRIEALAQPGKDCAALRQAVDQELARLAAEGPTEAEVEAARTQAYGHRARSLESLRQRARLLAEYQVELGDPDGLQRDLQRYQAATVAGVQAAARRILGPNRLVIEVLPEPAAAGGGR